MKNKRLAFALRALCFLLCLALLVCVADRILVNKNTASRSVAFYEEPKNTLDVLFVGSSRVMCGIYPLRLYEEYGIASFDCAGSAQVLAQSYFQLREAFTRQSPRIVVVETSTVANGDVLTGDENFVHAQLDYLRSPAVRISAIRTLIPREKRLEFYLPLVRFHSRFSDLDRRDFRLVPEKGRGSVVYHGRTKGAGTPEKIPESEYDPIAPTPAKYLSEIVALCRAHGAEVLFLNIPANPSAKLQRLHNGVAATAEELGVPYLNLFYQTEALGFDFETDLYDAAHCNTSGAEKITAGIGAFLSEHYDLPDRREDPAYDRWKEDLALWKEQNSL